MANALIKSPTNNCTLYELEGHLEALANSIAMAEDEPSRRLIWTRLGRRFVGPRRNGTASWPF
jgi:hypothetical protein